jgi:hypothetical protein
MADPVFRQEQQAHRYDENVRPINEMVDELRNDAVGLWMPYVAPVHGGTEARLLSVLRDAGPKTQEGIGSGFLCLENDDPTAESQRVAFAEVGLGAADITPWNSYPWYINRAPKAAELERGVEPLLRLIGMMPLIRVLFLQGGKPRMCGGGR